MAYDVDPQPALIGAVDALTSTQQTQASKMALQRIALAFVMALQTLFVTKLIVWTSTVRFVSLPRKQATLG